MAGVITTITITTVATVSMEVDQASLRAGIITTTCAVSMEQEEAVVGGRVSTTRPHR